jgi:protein CpxP
MMTQSLKGKILVFGVFFIGLVTGALLANFYDTRVNRTRPPFADRADRGGPAERARRDIDALHEYLGLTQEQRDQIQKILDDTRIEFGKLRKETRPRFEAIQQESRNKIRAVLTEEQRRKYDEFRRNNPPRSRNNDPPTHTGDQH